MKCHLRNHVVFTYVPKLGNFCVNIASFAGIGARCVSAKIPKSFDLYGVPRIRIVWHEVCEKAAMILLNDSQDALMRNEDRKPGNPGARGIASRCCFFLASPRDRLRPRS